MLTTNRSTTPPHYTVTLANSIDESLSYLVDDVDAVVDLLAAEDGVEVVQPVLQVVFPVAEWDDNGNLEAATSVLVSR